MAEILMRWDGEKLVPVTNIQRVTMVVNSGGLLNQPKIDTSLPNPSRATSKTINASNGLHNDYYYEITDV